MKIEDVRVGMRVVFTPAGSDREWVVNAKFPSGAVLLQRGVTHYTTQAHFIEPSPADARNTNAHLCEHANEVPIGCTCPAGCYCKLHTCQLPPSAAPTSPDPTTPGEQAAALGTLLPLTAAEIRDRVSHACTAAANATTDQRALATLYALLRSTATRAQFGDPGYRDRLTAELMIAEILEGW